MAQCIMGKQIRCHLSQSVINFWRTSDKIHCTDTEAPASCSLPGTLILFWGLIEKFYMLKLCQLSFTYCTTSCHPLSAALSFRVCFFLYVFQKAQSALIHFGITKKLNFLIVLKCCNCSKQFHSHSDGDRKRPELQMSCFSPAAMFPLREEDCLALAVLFYMCKMIYTVTSVILEQSKNI